MKKLMLLLSVIVSCSAFAGEAVLTKSECMKIMEDKFHNKVLALYSNSQHTVFNEIRSRNSEMVENDKFTYFFMAAGQAMGNTIYSALENFCSGQESAQSMYSISNE